MSKPSFTFLGSMVVALAIGQSGLTYRSPKANPVLTISGNEGFIVPDQNFALAGNVKVESKSDRITLTGRAVTGNFVKEGKQNVPDKVRLKGGVTVKQSQENGTLNMSGNEADYDLLGANAVNVKMRGNVQIRFAGDKPGVADWSSSASSATAVMKRGAKKDENALISAAVEGPLSYSGVSIGEKGTTKFNAKADRMAIKQLGEGYEVKLSGNLKFDQSGPGDDESGEVTGAQTAYLELNNKNEVTRIRFSSEGIGKIESIKRKPGGNAR